ncbi:MAG: N-6 DNA methylase [Chloroherpetonaceae bacterium]
MNSKEEARSKIASLIARFEEQYKVYTQTNYNEAQARIDYINPLFEALGWDVHNRKGKPESYREVIYEDKIVVEESQRAPDYAFCQKNGKRLFFLEAKKPSVGLWNTIYPAYQVRRYGWNAQLDISIVTDFEEFAVYDCRTKPNETDQAYVARIKYISFRDYLNEFDFLWDNFSKENCTSESLSKLAIATGKIKGTETVDKEFLKSLDRWRTLLAEDIAPQNPNLDEDEINFAVQQTIDRIIFLRIAEDRSVEIYGNLKSAIERGNCFRKLYEIFREADIKYNSGLFDFKKDQISHTLTISDKVLDTIINELYYPKCPYEFSVLAVEILGSAYEQFLGKTITIDEDHRAKIEEKPEVRKAGGVYYTPQYIVNYIVKNTIGKLLGNWDPEIESIEKNVRNDDKIAESNSRISNLKPMTPEDVSKIRICDPACGSGSFLIGAYQYLLDWHKDYYTKHDKNSKVLQPDGNLTTAEKKRILLNNIYGVDLDVNAVEVTKLSLLLKCMEGETEASINQQLKIFKERVLPTLDNNIKCGNSLIDIDFYDSQIDFEPGMEKKVKPFNWQYAFPAVFGEGSSGFDVVIGNPPWVDIKGHDPNLVKYYFKKFKTTENRINLYAIFIEQILQILNKNGLFSFIIPNSILYQSSYTKLRNLILNNNSIIKIIRLPDNIFNNVKAETIILVLSKLKIEQETKCLLYDRNKIISIISENNADKILYINQNKWINEELSTFNIFSDELIHNILNKIEINTIELSQICDFSLGITPYDKYKGHSETLIKNREFHSKIKIDDTFKELLEGADVQRYNVQWGQKEYIKYGDWLGAPRRKEFFTKPRILIRQIVSGNPPRIYAGYVDQELYNTQTIFNLILKPDIKVDIKFILSLINSNLMNFYHRNKYLDVSKHLFQKILIQNCKKIPIPKSPDTNIQNQLVQLVDTMLQLNKDLQKATLPNQKEQLKQRITYTDKKIDQLVYSLYGLTEEEINIVEGDVQL